MTLDSSERRTTAPTRPGTDAVTATAAPHMKRVLGLPALVFFGLAYMVPLTVWTTYGVVTNETSGHLPAAYIVTTAAMLLTALSYGRMAVAMPVAGSAYAYARKAFGGKTGFIVGWGLLLDYLFLPMICYLAIGLYMHDFFPSIPMSLWIIGSVVLVTSLNILGMRVLTGVNLTIVAAQFVFIAVFIVMAVRQIAADGAQPDFIAPFYSSSFSFPAVVAGAAILALSFLGFDAVSTLSEETTDAKRRIPRAILLCALVGGALYILQSYVGHLVFPNWQSFENVDVATVDVMTYAGGAFLNTFFTAAYVTGCFACAAASQASVSRILFAMGRDNVLPHRVFGTLHPRLLTPVLPNIIVGVVGLSALVVPLGLASSMISFGALAAFTFVNLSVIKLFARGARGGKVLTLIVLPALGVVFTLYLWTSLSGTTFTVGLSWLAIGFAYLLYLTRGLRREPPAMAMSEAPEAEGEPSADHTASPQPVGSPMNHHRKDLP